MEETSQLRRSESETVDRTASDSVLDSKRRAPRSEEGSAFLIQGAWRNHYVRRLIARKSADKRRSLTVYSSSLSGNMHIESANNRLRLLLEVLRLEYTWHDLVDNK